MEASHSKTASAFTIVELLLVVVIISILATITFVAYNGIANQAKESAMQSSLESVAKKLYLARARTGELPANLTGDTTASPTQTISYVKIDGNFCISITDSALPEKSYFIKENDSMKAGECPAGNPFMQDITTANCPTTKTVAIDARDNHTYWIQKIAGRCWMLSNLSYAGGTSNGGVATYGDTRTLNNGAGSSHSLLSPAYYEPTGSNVSLKGTDPSTSTDGGATNKQYGLLYNWCGAMGGQTAACNSANTGQSSITNTSVCPAGWRLPTADATTGEFTQLNTAINSGSTTSDLKLREDWLVQRSGMWYVSFSNQNAYAYFWSSTIGSDTDAKVMYAGASAVALANYYNKGYGLAARCITLP